MEKKGIMGRKQDPEIRKASTDVAKVLNQGSMITLSLFFLPEEAPIVIKQQSKKEKNLKQN